MKFYEFTISKNFVTMRFYGLSYGKTTFRVITDFYYSDFPGRKQPKKRNLLPDAEKFTLYSKLFCSYRPQAAPCRRKELLVTAQMRPSGLPAFCDILEKAGHQTQPAVLSLAFSAGKARLAGKKTGPAYCFGSFMVKPIRFLTGSALRTQTLTMSPTLSTSLGCLIYLLQI